jgi:dimethylargininase
MFTTAIVRKPCPEMIKGLTSANLGNPEYEVALAQHRKYIDALKNCGITVMVLDSDSRYPDSTFIEDTAIVTPYCAIITNPGASSRNGEKMPMPSILEQYYQNIHFIKDPGTLDGGDVMMVGSHYYIGLSDRTNEEGAKQLQNILSQYNMTASTVNMSTMLHLKTGLSYLENNNLLITGEFLQKPEFDSFNKIVVDENEAYSANSLWINGTVLVPMGYPGTLKKIHDLGYKTIELNLSEFRKLDGGLSCLSLRF